MRQGKMKNLLAALTSGLTGAIALNLIHESARHLSNKAPRVDRLGEQALAKTMGKLGDAAPQTLDDLYVPALLGDLASNSLYYALSGAFGTQNAVVSGAVLGAAAGLGAVYLPDKIGLRKSYTAANKKRAAMTIAWYFVGGLTAGLTYKLLAEDNT
jgi:hypothetical protein